jgi:hypothetical protein
MPFNPQNPTGFDMKKFKASAAPTSEWAMRDPWKSRYVVLAKPSPRRRSA